MANRIHFQLWTDTAENWESTNPVLWQNELGYDTTNRRIKFGDGATAWKDLPYVAPEVLDVLTSDDTKSALSANKGKELSEAISELENAINNLPEPENIDVIDNLESTDGTAALSAKMGNELAQKKVSYDDVINLTVEELSALTSYKLKQTAGIKTVKLLLTELKKYFLSSNVLKTASFANIKNSTIGDGSDYTSQDIVPSMKVIKYIVNGVLPISDVKTVSLATLRTKSASDYTTTETASMRLAKNLLTLIDAKVNTTDIAALQETVSKILSETWTFTLDSGSTVTKKVAVWSS